jgi:hypothetical protein
VTLNATATGPDPANLTYQWTSNLNIGALNTDVKDATGRDTVTFTCAAPGTATITLVVREPR